jgi:hypothetical protein
MSIDTVSPNRHSGVRGAHHRRGFVPWRLSDADRLPRLCQSSSASKPCSNPENLRTNKSCPYCLESGHEDDNGRKQLHGLRGWVTKLLNGDIESPGERPPINHTYIGDCMTALNGGRRWRAGSASLSRPS